MGRRALGEPGPSEACRCHRSRVLGLGPALPAPRSSHWARPGLPCATQEPPVPRPPPLAGRCRVQPHHERSGPQPQRPRDLPSLHRLHVEGDHRHRHGRPGHRLLQGPGWGQGEPDTQQAGTRGPGGPAYMPGAGGGDPDSCPAAPRTSSQPRSCGESCRPTRPSTASPAWRPTRALTPCLAPSTISPSPQPCTERATCEAPLGEPPTKRPPPHSLPEGLGEPFHPTSPPRGPPAPLL